MMKDSTPTRVLFIFLISKRITIMKKNILLLILNSVFLIVNCNAQTLSPQATPSAGGYFTGGGNSLSWTMGEPVTQTFQNGNLVLTQGFQQPYTILLSALNLKLFIEGYYMGGGLMQPVLFNTGLSLNDTDCDSIIVELYDQFSNTILFSDTVLLNTNGLASVQYPNSLYGGSYFIVVRVRNAIETWSKLPVTFNNTPVYFDFSSQ